MAGQPGENDCVLDFERRGNGRIYGDLPFGAGSGRASPAGSASEFQWDRRHRDQGQQPGVHCAGLCRAFRRNDSDPDARTKHRFVAATEPGERRCLSDGAPVRLYQSRRLRHLFERGIAGFVSGGTITPGARISIQTNLATGTVLSSTNPPTITWTGGDANSVIRITLIADVNAIGSSTATYYVAAAHLHFRRAGPTDF